jgi:hypothetical protein
MCILRNIRELCEAGRRAYAGGNAANGEFMLLQARALAKGLNSPVLEAKILNAMAVFALEARHTEKAATLLLEAREKVKKKAGTENFLYKVISNNLREAGALAQPPR